MEKQTEVVPFGETDIQARILTVRGVQVMLDYDLAELYGVETKQLKRQVRRNIKRFPTDFMVELGEDQMKSLRCQFGTSNRGGDRYGAYAFSEQGIAMLSSVLRSERAIEVNIGIMKVRLYCKDRGQPTPVEIEKFNRQYKDLTITYTDEFHDRFLIIDNAELHNLGSSINCLGRRVTSYTTRDPSEITKLLALLPKIQHAQSSVRASSLGKTPLSSE